MKSFLRGKPEWGLQLENYLPKKTSKSMKTWTQIRTINTRNWWARVEMFKKFAAAAPSNGNPRIM
jgi:hypothetical protein